MNVAPPALIRRFIAAMVLIVVMVGVAIAHLAGVQAAVTDAIARIGLGLTLLFAAIPGGGRERT